MSHETGAYLGGVAALEDLRARCRIDPDTQCWHWGLGCSQGAPRVWVRLEDGSRQSMRGRYAALLLRDGVRLPKGHFAWASAVCKSLDCVNPAHCKSGSRKQWGADVSKRGSMKGLPAKVRANREIGRRRRALTDEQAQMVKHCDKSTTALAAELGVSKTLIAEVRRGRRYVKTMHAASVFSWAGSLT